MGLTYALCKYETFVYLGLLVGLLTVAAGTVSDSVATFGILFLILGYLAQF